jgi:hypothetical protein
VGRCNPGYAHLHLQLHSTSSITSNLLPSWCQAALAGHQMWALLLLLVAKHTGSAVSREGCHLRQLSSRGSRRTALGHQLHQVQQGWLRPMGLTVPAA